VRTALIFTHVLVVLALTLPHPALVADRSRWDSGRGRMELASWTRTLNRLGVDISETELEAKAWSWATAYADWYRRYLAPLTLYSRYLHVRQQWSMFTHPKQRVGRVWIEIDRGSGFEPVFVSKSDEHTWNGDVLTHNRIRKLFNRVTSHRYKEGFDEFAEWIAPQLARDFPTATRARVRIENYVTPTPEQSRAGVHPKGTFTRTRVLDLRARP